MNQGILRSTGFVNKENINPSGTWSLGLLQMDFFYRCKPWYAGQFVRKIIPKFKIEKSCIHFFTVILNKIKTKLLSVLVRDVDAVFRNIKIKLPTKNNKIDFEFIKLFVSELENDRITKLSSYLKKNGLDNYELTNDEKLAITVFEKMISDNWKEYKMVDLFERISTKKLPYKAKELPNQLVDKCTLPCLTSSFHNQGLNYYAPRNSATVLKGVISIPSNSDVYRAYYQSMEFTVLSDAYAIQWKSKMTELTPNQYLFMVMCINKVTDLPIYSYKNKLGGWNVVKEKYIQLPTKEDKIDFDFMEHFISALKKNLIKDVVLYIENYNKLS